MEEKQGYDVLRIVVHSGRYYMSTDYIRGKQLILWLKYHSRIRKELLFEWIRELMGELELFHQCKGNPSYQYVNPYSIIVGEDEKLYLLDLGSREQDELLHLMQRRYVRENFLSPVNQYYQKPSIQEDIYGFGKTIQYLLSAVETEPSLRKIEELKLQKMISRCVNRNSKKCYQTIHEISEHFPRNKKRDNHKILPVRKGLVFAVVLTGIAVIGTQVMGQREWSQEREKGGEVLSDISDTENTDSKILEDYREELRQEKEQWDAEREKIAEEFSEREKELVYEIALIYFVDLEDYQKSREALESLEEPEKFAKDFAKLCVFMEGQVISDADQDMEKLLENLEREVPNPGEERYAYCISKGYQKMKEAAREARTEEIGEETGQEGEQQEEHLLEEEQ